MHPDVIDVSLDNHGHVVLQHIRRVSDSTRQPGFTISPEAWNDLLWRAACYELEYGRLRHAALHIPLRDALGNRMM